MRSVKVVAIDNHDSQQELIRLVQRIDDFVAADRDGALALGAALDFNMTIRLEGAVRIGRWASGDIPAALLG